MDWGIGVAGTRAISRSRAGGWRRRVDRSGCDIYSFGCGTGLSPKSGSLPLGAVVPKAMGQDPAQRYPDAVSLNLEVGRFLDGLAVEAYHEVPWTRPRASYEENTCLLLDYVV